MFHVHVRLSDYAQQMHPSVHFNKSDPKEGRYIYKWETI